MDTSKILFWLKKMGREGGGVTSPTETKMLLKTERITKDPVSFLPILSWANLAIQSCSLFPVVTACCVNSAHPTVSVRNNS